VTQLPPAHPSTVDFFDLSLGMIASIARDAIVVIDEQQTIVALNAAALQMFGYEQHEVLGQPLLELVPEPYRSMHEQHVREFDAASQLERHMMARATIQGRHSSGRAFPAEVSVSRVELLVDGQARVYFVSMLRDLSVERDLRAEVLTLNARLRTVLDLTPAAMWIVEGETVVYANRAMVDLFGLRDRSQLIGRSIHTLLHNPAPDVLQAHLAQAQQPMTSPLTLGGTITHADGTHREVEIATTALPDHGRAVVQMVLTDVTQQRAQALEQTRHRQELRRLAANVVEAREEERRRIARELHDELGQRLTALKMALHGLRADDPRHDASGHVAGVLDMVDNTVAAVRRISADLRPLMLDDLGLNAAIEWLARDAARRMDMAVTVRLDAEDPPLAPGADIALYRMVQEALTNVGRHARATDVRISLRREGDELVLTVHDNGRGFPDRAMRQENRYGLLGIRERAIMLGGRLDVDNPPGGGGRIVVRLPLKPAAAGKVELP
jgi:PAS domain S-box-containing protein